MNNKKIIKENNKQLIKEIILEKNPLAIFLSDKYNEAILGYGISCGQNYVAVYDSDKCIEIIMNIFNINDLEAEEQLRSTTEQHLSSPHNPFIFSDFRNIVIPKFTDIDIDMTIDKL